MANKMLKHKPKSSQFAHKNKFASKDVKMKFEEADEVTKFCENKTILPLTFNEYLKFN